MRTVGGLWQLIGYGSLDLQCSEQQKTNDTKKSEPKTSDLMPAIQSRAENPPSRIPPTIGNQKFLKDYPELLMMFGTPYTACFQWAISIIVDYARDHGKGERMVFIHEVNDYRGECIKAFEYVKDKLNPRQIPMTLTFAAKEDYPPLQAADVLAYEGGKFLKNPTGTPRRAFTAIDPDKTRIIARRYGKDNMPELIRLLINFRAKLLAQGWDGKVVA
jgi:hypothetical protein